MHIKSVHMKRFRGFQDFKIDLDQFTNLVGENSRGKTTILQAIRFAFEAAANCPNKSGSSTDSSFNSPLQAELNRLTLNDPEAARYDRDVTANCEISLDFDDDLRITVKLNDKPRPSVNLRDVSASLPMSVDEVYRDCQRMADCNLQFVPPIGATSGLETWRNRPAFDKARNEGQHSEIWRNSLFWSYNDGDKRAFDDAVSLVKRYVPVDDIHPPRLGHESTSSIAIEYSENEKSYDIGLSGSGMRSLLNLATVLLLSKSKIILLDEPDAHLHGRLQRAVAKMIQDFSVDHGVQIVVATHAPDFVAECDPESIVWIDREASGGKRATQLSKVLVDLGSISASELFDSDAKRRILFTEGEKDRFVLRQLMERCVPKFDFDSVRPAKLPSGKSTAESIPTAKAMLSQLGIVDPVVACLVDNDWELIGGDYDAPNHVITLPRKEIENVFLDANAIASVVSEELEKRGKPIPADLELEIAGFLSEACEDQRRKVRSKLVWQYVDQLDRSHDRSTREERADAWFDERWKDDGWRIKAIGGKKAFSFVRRKIQESYGVTVTNRAVLDALTEVPSDIAECFRKLVEMLSD